MQVFLLTILGFILRIINIVKPEGLWNDEYVSWMISSVPFNNGFWTEVLKQCHMPLYYLYLKPFSGCSDIVLRLTSVIPAVLAIVVMYFAGKQYSKKAGNYAAAITSVLPFLIYYSQEVRFYSLLFLLSALFLLSFLIVINNDNKKGWIVYSFISALIVFTHVLGIFFVLPFSIYLMYKKNKLNIKSLTILIASIACVIPFGLKIIKMMYVSQWWGHFSYTNILFLFSDFFSPILTNHVNAQPVFFYIKEPFFIFLIAIPTLIGLAGMFFDFKKTKSILLLSLFPIVLFSVLAQAGKIVFITKYLIELLPFFILAMSVGFSKNKVFEFIGICFILINLLSVFTSYHPIHKIRFEGHNLPAESLNVQKPDEIIFTYYSPDRFARYLNFDSNMTSIDKTKRFDYANNAGRIFDNIKSKEKTAVVFLDSVSFIPEEYLKHDNNNFPEMFVTFSEIRHSLESTFNSVFKDVHVEKRGNWTILYGIKI